MFLSEDIMNYPPITISKDKTVKEALDLLAAHNISGMPVTDIDNQVIGIISGADIMHYSQQKKLIPFSNTSLWVTPSGSTDDDLQMLRSGFEVLHRTMVEQVMTKKVYTASKDTPISDVAKLMNQHNVNRIPIVDSNNKLIGIITRSDLVKYMSSSET